MYTFFIYEKSTQILDILKIDWNIGFVEEYIQPVWSQQEAPSEY